MSQGQVQAAPEALLISCLATKTKTTSPIFPVDFNHTSPPWIYKLDYSPNWKIIEFTLNNLGVIFLSMSSWCDIDARILLIFNEPFR